jgi:hypothetical protein
MLDSYAAFASGVLSGMSEGLQAGARQSPSSVAGAVGGGSAAAPPERAAPRAARKRTTR